MRFPRSRPTFPALLILVAVAACGGSASEVADPSSAGDVASRVATTTATAGAESPDSCPVTIPRLGFAPPLPYPAEYPHEGLVWYGTEGLWTALDVGGDHTPRKSVWWSINFPGGSDEERPEVWVTWTRLDTDESVVIDNLGRATNAYTAEEGWFMIAGIDPPEPGCWRVEATYEGATLSYVYDSR